MKAEIIQTVKPFEPVEVKLTFHSQEEIDVFYTLFNVCVLCDWIRKECQSPMPENIRSGLSLETSSKKDEFLIKLSGELFRK